MGENRKFVDIVIARARDDGVLDEDGDGRSGEKWLDSRHILKVS